MAEVILLETIKKLGTVGKLVTVKDGYARNYLLPRKKALRATKENKAYLDNKIKELENNNLEKKDISQQIAGKIDNLTIKLIRQAGEDGRLFGSVTTRDIANALSEQNFNIDRGDIELINPIKSVGIFEVNITLHAEVQVKIKVHVARSEDENIDL